MPVVKNSKYPITYICCALFFAGGALVCVVCQFCAPHAHCKANWPQKVQSCISFSSLCSHQSKQFLLYLHSSWRAIDVCRSLVENPIILEIQYLYQYWIVHVDVGIPSPSPIIVYDISIEKPQTFCIAMTIASRWYIDLRMVSLFEYGSLVGCDSVPHQRVSLHVHNEIRVAAILRSVLKSFLVGHGSKNWEIAKHSWNPNVRKVFNICHLCPTATKKHQSNDHHKAVAICRQ